MGCAGGGWGLLRGFRVYLCQKRLRLSLKLDECEPLAAGFGVGNSQLTELHVGTSNAAASLAGRCRLTLSNPRRKRLEGSA